MGFRKVTACMVITNKCLRVHELQRKCALARIVITKFKATEES